MDAYLSHMSWRREPWKGHESAEGVRRSIRYARSHNRVLTLFFLDSGRYVPVRPEDWDAVFFTGTEA